MRKFSRKFLATIICGLLALNLSVLAGAAAADTETDGINSLIIIGDSISSGYGLADPATESYGAKLAVAFGLTGNSYSNTSVDGANSAAIAQNLKQTLSGPEGAAAFAQYDTILISVGGNDILGTFFDLATDALGVDLAGLQMALLTDPEATAKIQAAIATPEAQAAFAAATSDFAANLTSIVTSVKQANPTANIYIQTIYNPFDGVIGLDALSAAAKSALGVINGSITQGAALGYSVIDVETAFAGQALALTNIASFDIHPNAAGHDVIFKLAYDAIAQTPLAGGELLDGGAEDQFTEDRFTIEIEIADEGAAIEQPRSGAPDKGSDNPETGIVIALVPMMAAGMALLVSRKIKK